jgi:PAS domain S-box-containing protein
MADTLRQKAEELLSRNPEITPTLSTVEVQKLFHELNVHQIELQMQNEELRHAQEELAHSRDSFVELYDFAPVGYLILNPEGRIRDANFTAATLLGTERGRLIGSTFAGLVRRESLDAWERHRRHVMATGQKHSTELSLQRPDGKVISVQVECTPRPASDLFLMALVDITEKLQAAAVQEHQRELLQQIFDNIPILLVMRDPHLGRFVLNRHAREVLGWSSADAEEHDLMTLVYPDPDYRAKATAYIKSLEPGWREWICTAKSGERIPIEWANIRLSDATAIGIGVDLRKRKQVEEALRKSEQELALLNLELEKRVEQRTAELKESEEKYRLVFESESDAIMIFDGETRRFVDVNSAAEKLYGYTRDEFLQLNCSAITAEPDDSDVSIRETMARRITSVPRRLHRKKDGSVFPAQITGCTFSWKGRPVVCGVIRDITEPLKREESILRSQNELRRLASELSLAEQRERQRIAVELHDGLCQLLISAHIRLGTLKKTPLPETAIRELDAICEIIQQAVQDIRDLTFELSCPTLSELGLSAALEELCADLSQEHAVRFEFKGEEIPLAADSQLVLYRSVRELLINIMKHAEAKHAWVELRREGGDVCISVRDDGIGFDAGATGNGFSPSGGFGLFNIREFLRHIGGTLTIESIPGNGTRVVLTAPLEETT